MASKDSRLAAMNEQASFNTVRNGTVPEGIRALPLWRVLFDCSGALVLAPLALWAQVAMGQQFTVLPLHLFVVAQLSWAFGFRGAWFGVTGCSVLWLIGTFAGSWDFDGEWLRYYNWIARSTVYALLAALLVFIQDILRVHRARLAALRALLGVCPRCGAVRNDSNGESGDGRLVGAMAAGVPGGTRCPECRAQAQG
jgi:hypothetical protein